MSTVVGILNLVHRHACKLIIWQLPISAQAGIAQRIIVWHLHRTTTSIRLVIGVVVLATLLRIYVFAHLRRRWPISYVIARFTHSILLIVQVSVNSWLFLRFAKHMFNNQVHQIHLKKLLRNITSSNQHQQKTNQITCPAKTILIRVQTVVPTLVFTFIDNIRVRSRLRFVWVRICSLVTRRCSGT